MKIDWVEVMGVIATLFVFIGFTQSDTKRIRILNSIGSLLFVVYGVILGALSVWLLNGACLILNVYKIVKESKAREIRHARKIHHIVNTNENNNALTETPDIKIVRNFDK